MGIHFFFVTLGKMMSMKKYVFSLFFFVMLSMACTIGISAQISYTNNRLLIGEGATPYYYHDIIANSRGISLQGPSGSFYRIDLSQNMPPMISGYGNAVMFYNPISGDYSSIVAQQVYTLVNPALQTNMVNFTSGIDVIKRLRPVSYSVASVQSNTLSGNQYTGSNAGIGISVQELEEVLPNLVYTDVQGQKLIDYMSLIPVLVDAVQALQHEVECLKSKLDN